MGYIMFGVIVFLLDIMTKLVVEIQLKGLDTIALWQNVFHLTYVENRGIAFGMFSGQRMAFILVTAVVLGLLALIYTKTPQAERTRWLKYGVALVYGGACGNLIERMAKGYVVDFLDFRLIHFPVFNVADIAVCVGAVLLVIHFLISERKAEQTKALPKEGENRE